MHCRYGMVWRRKEQADLGWPKSEDQRHWESLSGLCGMGSDWWVAERGRMHIELRTGLGRTGDSPAEGKSWILPGITMRDYSCIS